MLIQDLKMAEPETQPSLKKKKRPLGLSYLIDENPPWYICLLLGFQVRRVQRPLQLSTDAKHERVADQQTKKIRFMLIYLCLRLCHSFLAGNFQFNLRVDLHSKCYSRVASVSRRAFVRNHSYENVFSLYVHFQVN